MKLTFLGATHEVTGSCSLIECGDLKFLVDYGMEQGRDIYKNEDLPVEPAAIDFVLLTHAHIDHSGLLPLLYARGFRGAVYGTTATCNLCEIMLRDSAHIQEFEAEWRNRKGQRAGQDVFVPLYTMEDAEGLITQLRAHNYGEIFELAPNVRVRFTDAGHLLGSASVEVLLSENGEERKIVFSGDLGNINQPLLRDPQLIDIADYVVMESTYGDRLHETPPDYATAFAAVLQQTFDRGGDVIIPSFAVGRTQELLYFLRHIKSSHMVKGHDHFPVYVDSPMAIEATRVFTANSDCCFDEEATSLLQKGVNPIAFDDLRLTVSTDESRRINDAHGGRVIISASGMCEAGRIKHHLKHGLWRPENTIVFVGFQAAGTLGRSLLDGAKKVKLFGEEISVQATITQLPGISGHGDRNELERWITHFDPVPLRVFVNHGESTVCDSFADRLRNQYGLTVSVPYSGEQYDLLKNVCLFAPGPQPLTDKAQRPAADQRLTELRRISNDELVSITERLYECAQRGVRDDADLGDILKQLRKISKQLE